MVFALEKARGKSREELLRIYRQEELDRGDVENVLDILDEVGAQEQSYAITEDSAHEALEALRPITLPSWAQREAASLVGFLANREF